MYMRIIREIILIRRFFSTAYEWVSEWIRLYSPDLWPLRAIDGPLHGVLKLPYIPWPGISLDERLGLRGEEWYIRKAALGGHTGGEVVCQ